MRLTWDVMRPKPEAAPALSSCLRSQYRMKKTFLALVPAVLLASAAAVTVLPNQVAQAGGSATQVRAVNLDKVIQKSSKAKALMQEFQRFQQQKQTEMRKEQEALEKEQRRLSANSSKDELAAYGQKVQTVARKLQTAEMETQQRFAETRMKLLKALEPTLAAFARDNSIGMILDSNSGGVVYVSPSWDSTNDLLPRIK